MGPASTSPPQHTLLGARPAHRQTSILPGPDLHSQAGDPVPRPSDPQPASQPTNRLSKSRGLPPAATSYGGPPEAPTHWRTGGKPGSGPSLAPQELRPPLTPFPPASGRWEPRVGAEDRRSPAPRGPAWCRDPHLGTGRDLSLERGAHDWQGGPTLAWFPVRACNPRDGKRRLQAASSGGPRVVTLCSPQCPLLVARQRGGAVPALRTCLIQLTMPRRGPGPGSALLASSPCRSFCWKPGRGSVMKEAVAL